MGTKSRCSLLAYINIWKELLLSCLRDKVKIVPFKKLLNFYFDLRPPSKTPGQTREAREAREGVKTQPLGQLERANAWPGVAWGGMVRLGIDWYIIGVLIWILNNHMIHVDQCLHIGVLNHISTGGGGGVFSTPSFAFLPVTFCSWANSSKFGNFS